MIVMGMGCFGGCDVEWVCIERRLDGGRSRTYMYLTVFGGTTCDLFGRLGVGGWDVFFGIGGRSWIAGFLGCVVDRRVGGT